MLFHTSVTFQFFRDSRQVIQHVKDRDSILMKVDYE